MLTFQSLRIVFMGTPEFAVASLDALVKAKCNVVGVVTALDKPAGWYFSTSGKHSMVTTVKNKPGKWVQLGYNNPVSSNFMKNPLPENFTLEYDLVTDGEFSSRSGGAASLILTTRHSNTNGSENVYSRPLKAHIIHTGQGFGDKMSCYYLQENGDLHNKY